MKLTEYIIALVIGLMLLSCGKNSSIIGRWKQVENEPYDSLPSYKAERVLTILADSSFTFDDGTINDVDTTVSPGRHTGGGFKGHWRMPDAKHFELTLDPKFPVMIFNYEILKLTGRELELIFAGWKNLPEVKPLRYSRL